MGTARKESLVPSRNGLHEERGNAPCDLLMTRWLRSLVPRSRHRAGRSQFTHDLAVGHGEHLFQQQRGLCAISGLPFSLAEFAGVLVKHPFAPSLDRISSQGGYTADNVRLVCIAVNFGMGQWGEELYLTFARAAVEHCNQVNHATFTKAGVVLQTAPLHTPGEAETAWSSEQRERIAAAETIAATLSGESLIRQRRRIASLKRNLTLGPAGLKAAATKAVQTRSG
jgi:hypothetical protein